MKKHIYIDKATKAKLREIFKVSEVMIWKALTFDSSSDLARKIRYTAVTQYGGIMVGDTGASDCDTIHESDELMTQHFTDRVKIVLYKKSGRTCVLIDGVVKKTEDNLSVAEFMQLQKEVQRIAADLQSR